MRAALLREYHTRLELVDHPTPEITRPDEVLVKVGGAGVCATDLHAIEGLMEPAGVTLPRVLGHENAGWVEAVGDLVSTVSPGDPVILYPPYSCGLCVPCRRGDDMHCVNHDFTGLSLDGGFADYVLVRERSVIKLPEGLSPAQVAPHADAGLTAYHAVRRVAGLMKPGTNTVVIGIGGVGHIAVQLARDLGASRVIAIDTEQERLDLASELGADEIVRASDGASNVIRELTGGRGADVVLDFVGTNATHSGSMEMLARAGTYSVVGYGGNLPLTSMGLVVDEKTVVGNLVGCWTDLYELIQLHAAGRVTLRVETHPLEAINEVLDKLRGGEILGRAVLVPG
ncbi:MAG TPA: NAD(P)-dependent alcohol dehydrogenase [Thermoleophilaceae bacterium]|jgi:NAD+-dependent secondary alcohol dehydrogenase Adh1